MEKEVDQRKIFLDVLIDKSDSQSPATRVYHNKIFTGLLTNYLVYPPPPTILQAQAYYNFSSLNLQD